MDINLLDYLSVTDHNIKGYLYSNPDIFRLALDLDDYFLRFYRQVESTKGLRDDRIGGLLLQFVHTSHRSLRNAFLSHMQGGVQEGQLILRIGLEAAGYAFIIWKKPALADAWLDKDNPKHTSAYLAFKKRQFPRDMPHRKWFADYLDKLNEEMSHPNVFNRGPKTTLTNDHVVLSFIDKDEAFVRPHTFALLDSWMKTVDVYRMIFATKLVLFTKETEELVRSYPLAYERIRASFRQPPARVEQQGFPLIVVPKPVLLRKRVPKRR